MVNSAASISRTRTIKISPIQALNDKDVVQSDEDEVVESLNRQPATLKRLIAAPRK